MVSIYEELLNLSKRGEVGVLVTVIEKEGSGPLPPGAKMLVRPDGQTVGTIGGGALERMAAAQAGDVLKEQRPLLQRYALVDDEKVATEEEATHMICGGKVTLFYEYLFSGPHLYIFGGGHVGRALTNHLQHLPYYVTVIDQRPGIESTLGDVARVVITAYETALADETVPAGSYFIIATPDHGVDYLLLRRIFASNWGPRYVGLLASRAKATKMTNDLKEDLGLDAVPDALYAPVGLDIGGKTVDEIAVSVLAEIQAVRYGRAGQAHLRLGISTI